jgi:hypothetical protein
VPVERTTLYWKWEDGPPDGLEDDPNAVGPAWIIRPDGSKEAIADGEWITRAEAERLAEEHGHALDADA